MRREDLVEILAERPFLPLRIHMSNGRTHEIRHPKMAIVGGDVVALGIVNGEDDPPRIRLISLEHINEVETVSTS